MRRSAAWLAACAVALSSGCASTRASRLRAERLESGLDALRYAQPPEEVWQHVRQLLADRGCPLAEADADAIGQNTGALAGLFSPAKETHPYRADTGLFQQLGAAGARRAKAAAGSVSLDTDWRRKEGDRYHADGLVETDGFRVIFTRIEFDPSNYRETRTRDLELELALARRIDPQAAERIESTAGASGSR